MSDRENERPDDQMKCVYMGPPMKKSVIASLREKFIGKKPEKKTPYPQSFADEKDPDDEPHGPDPSAIEGVYAGPALPDIPPMAPVYAGPEMMNGQPGPAVPEPEVKNGPRMMLVYGGPGMMSGPENVKERSGAKRPRMEALYAAPRRPDASRMMMVYAGPDYFANNKNSQTPMMAAYAGPSVDMSMTLAERMAAAQKEAEEQYRKEHPGSLMVKCPTCGSIVPKLKFCGECGAMFPKEEESNAPSPAEESGPEA